MSKLRKLNYLILMLIACSNLTGCILLAAGAGAAGGYYASKHYDSHKHNPSLTSTTDT